MFLFIDFCQVGWLPIILSFPLGLLLGWLLWGRIKSELEELREESARYRRKVQEQENELHASSQRIAQFESQQYSSEGHPDSKLEISRQRMTQLEGELALAKGEILELKGGGELELARKRITELEGQLALAQGDILNFTSDQNLKASGITKLKADKKASKTTKKLVSKPAKKRKSKKRT